MGSREVKKICNCLSTNMLQWKLATKEGKLILDSISLKLYNKDEDHENEQKNKDEQLEMEELQKLCNNLSEILSKMENIVTELESVEDKCVGLTQLCDMSSTSFNKSQAAANQTGRKSQTCKLGFRTNPSNI